MNRRELLAAMPLGAAGLMLTGCGSAPSEPQQRQLESFGLQLSTITPLLMADFEGTLAAVAAIGYREVEFSALGFLGRDVQTVQQLLQTNRLRAPVGRISPKLPADFGALSREQQMAAFRTYSGPDHLLNNVRASLEHAVAMGQKHLVLPALMPDNFVSRAQVQRSIDLLTQAGEICAAAGVQFGYHNHNWEFAPVDGVVPYDLMLESIPAELMAGQLDVYWVTKAGRDPLEYLAEHPGRFPSCHLKDIDEAGDFADVGDGLIDFPGFVAAAMSAGTQYYFVERDNPPQPMQTARRAYAYLHQMRY